MVLSPEIHILNKYLKKQLPFILEVSDVEIYERRDKRVLFIDVYVSPLHYCELLDERVNDKISWFVKGKVFSIIKALFPEWNDDGYFEIRFFPSVSEKTDILEYLP